MSPLTSRSTDMTSTGTPWLWIGLLSVASVALSFKLSCATPFAALATLAALHMRKSDGLALVALAWGLNQAVGYGVLGYPHDMESYAWGAAIGVAALATLVTAWAVAQRLAPMGSIAMMAGTLLAGFAAYEIVLFATTAVLPASELAFSWSIIGQIGLVNALVFPALLLAHRGAQALGLIGERATT